MKEEVYVRRHKDVLYEKAGMVLASPASKQPAEDSAVTVATRFSSRQSRQPALLW